MTADAGTGELRHFEVRMDIDAPVGVVWRVAGDPSSIPSWYPLYPRCEVDGDVRRAWRQDGVVLVERLLERNEAEHRYAYSVIEGAPVRRHRATIQVLERVGGSTVVWRTEFEPEDPEADLASLVVPRHLDALQRMRRLIEASGGERT